MRTGGFLGGDLNEPVHVIVYESETDGLVATEQRVKSESENDIRRSFVHFRQLIPT